MACLAEQDLTKAGEGQTSLANLSHLPLSQHLIAAITKLLDSKNVPNVLWGSFLGIVYGVIWRGGDAGFIVPDRDMATACDALCSAGLSLCLDPECYNVRQNRGTPLPDQHFHLQNRYESIELYPQSRTLSDISDLSAASQTDVDSPLIYASNPNFPRPEVDGFGDAAFSSDLYPVRVPSVRYYTETCLRNLVIEMNKRDSCETFAGFYDFSDIYYLHTVEFLALHTYSTGLFSTASLKPRYRDFMDSMLTFNSSTHNAVAILRAKEKLLENEEK